MMCTTTITRQRLNDSERIDFTAQLFGIHFPLPMKTLTWEPSFFRSQFMMCTTTSTCQRLKDSERISFPAELFGVHFPLLVEPFVYGVTESMAPEYKGGYWQFYRLSNGAFYMAPDSGSYFPVACQNGYDGVLSADALGITACLYAYSHLSFLDNPVLAETCAEQYHWLRDDMLEQTEAEAILGAID